MDLLLAPLGLHSLNIMHEVRSEEWKGFAVALVVYWGYLKLRKEGYGKARSE